MFVEHLSLVDFRNYVAAELALAPGANVLVGRNGQGKTNLAEAIAYLATLRSHRVPRDAPLVRSGREAAFVRARLAHGDRQVTLELQINKQGTNRARVNGSAVRATELPRYAQAVLFAPEDLQIVRGEPSGRRRFSDDFLIQRTPRLTAVLADYDRVVRQRNALLKSARASRVPADSLQTLTVWDEHLVTFGSEIIEQRRRMVRDLAEPLSRSYARVSGEDHEPTVSWTESIGAGPVRDAFAETLTNVRDQELERGVTLAGPHRDDLVLGLRGLPVKGYASHGESWSMALALRLAAADLLRSESPGGDPVLILDDVFAELDTHRRARLADVVADYEQTIVTAAVASDVPEALRQNAVRIEGGRVLGSLADHPLTGAES